MVGVGRPNPTGQIQPAKLEKYGNPCVRQVAFQIIVKHKICVWFCVKLYKPQKTSHQRGYIWVKWDSPSYAVRNNGEISHCSSSPGDIYYKIALADYKLSKLIWE